MEPTTPSVMGESVEAGSTPPVVATTASTEPVATVSTATPPVPEVAPERTLKVIQKELLDAGFPKDQVKGLQSKAVAQAVLDSMTKNPVATAKPKLEKVATIEEKLNPKEEKLIEQQYNSRKDIMRAKLEAQPQVPIFIPKADDKPAGIVKKVLVRGKTEYVKIGGETEEFINNGYVVIVPKGVQTTVPAQIFNQWAESVSATQRAGSEFSVDRIDPETGRRVGDRL